MTSVPVCTRDQLTRVLQQIKSERGTMAGMSIDDVTQQVAQRLAQNQRPVRQYTPLTLPHYVFVVTFLLFIAHFIFNFITVLLATRAYSTSVWS